MRGSVLFLVWDEAASSVPMSEFGDVGFGHFIESGAEFMRCDGQVPECVAEFLDQPVALQGLAVEDNLLDFVCEFAGFADES